MRAVSHAAPAAPEPEAAPPDAGEPLIAVRGLVHDYMRGTPLQVRAVHDVSLDVYPGEVVGLIGHTGSGKSTVVQHLNGLLAADGGSVTVLGQELSGKRGQGRKRMQVRMRMRAPCAPCAAR